MKAFEKVKDIGAINEELLNESCLFKHLLDNVQLSKLRDIAAWYAATKQEKMKDDAFHDHPSARNSSMQSLAKGSGPA